MHLMRKVKQIKFHGNPGKFKKLKYFCKNSVNTELKSTIFE